MSFPVAPLPRRQGPAGRRRPNPIHRCEPLRTRLQGGDAREPRRGLEAQSRRSRSSCPSMAAAGGPPGMGPQGGGDDESTPFLTARTQARAMASGSEQMNSHGWRWTPMGGVRLLWAAPDRNQSGHRSYTHDNDSSPRGGAGRRRRQRRSRRRRSC